MSYAVISLWTWKNINYYICNLDSALTSIECNYTLLLIRNFNLQQSINFLSLLLKAFEIQCGMSTTPETVSPEVYAEKLTTSMDLECPTPPPLPVKNRNLESDRLTLTRSLHLVCHVLFNGILGLLIIILGITQLCSYFK